MSDQCIKIKYKTKRKAWGSALYYFTKHGTFSGAYKCRCCKAYHLSRQVKDNPPLFFIKKLDTWLYGDPVTKQYGK